MRTRMFFAIAIISLLMLAFISHATTDTIGGTSSGGDGGNAGYILWQKITSSSSGTLSSVGVNVDNAAGNEYTGIYSCSGSNVGSLLGNSISTAATTGWNDLSIPGSVTISASTCYYIFYEQSNNAWTIYYSTGTGTGYYQTATYGTFPAPSSPTSYSAGVNMRMTYAASTSTTSVTTTSSTTTIYYNTTIGNAANALTYTNTTKANTIYWNDNALTLRIYASIPNGNYTAFIGNTATFTTANFIEVMNHTSTTNDVSELDVPKYWYWVYNSIHGSAFANKNNAFVYEYINSTGGTTYSAGTGISISGGVISNTNISASKITGSSPISVTSYTVGCSTCFTGSTINYQFVAPIITEPVATGTENVTLGIDPASLLLYESATASPDVANNDILGFIPYATRSTSTFTSVANNQELMSFISNKTVPSALFLPAGRVIVHQHAIQTAGTQQAELYAKVYLTTATGVPVTLLGTSVRSGVLSATETEWNLTFFSYNALFTPSITPANRIMTEIFVATAGGGTAPTIQLVYGGEADSQTDTPYFVVTGNVTYPLYHNVNGSLRFAYNHTNTFINVSGNFSVKPTTTIAYTGGKGINVAGGVISNTNISLSKLTATNGIYETSGYQIGVIAGSNIANTLDQVSATTSTYTAGTGLGLSGSQFYLLPLTGQSPITITTTNTISCSTCFTGSTVTTFTTYTTVSTVTTYTTYTTVSTINYIGSNGIIVSGGNIEDNTTSPLSNTINRIGCPTCFTGTTTSVTSITTTSVTTVTSFTTYTTLTTIAYTGANGIIVSGGTIEANTTSPLSNTINRIGCPTCFTGTTTSVTTATTTSSTSLTTTTVYVPIYTFNYPLYNSPTNTVSLLYNTSQFFLNATNYLSWITTGHGGGTTYTALAPLYINAANQIYLSYNPPLYNVGGILNCTGCTGSVINDSTVKWVVINQANPDT